MADENDDKKVGPSAELKSINIIGKIIGFAVMLWLVSHTYYGFAFFVLAMIPALLAMLIDRGAGKFASKTVSACNFVGVMPFLFELLLSYERDIAAKELMNNPGTWVVIYGFSAIGWIIIWALPQLTIIFYSIRADIKHARLVDEQRTLIDRWGEEVKTGADRILPGSKPIDDDINDN